jgi:hypothetical protein
MPANTYTLIEKIVIGATSAERITFTSIPQGYTDLKIVASVRSESPNPYDFIYGYVNGVSGIHYPGRRLRGDGSSASSATSNVGYFDLQYVNGDGATASAFGNLEIYFPNYSGSNQKSFSIDSVTETNSTTAYAHIWSYNYTNGTSAITSIVLASGSGYFKQYSSFYLYGIAKEGVSPSPSSAPYATGGDSIVFDGTYWYHTFRSSGTFTPKKGLTCDYLVVAGGGGSYRDASGGGGAGGLRSTVTATGGGGSLESALSLTASTNYTVTIGAGGTGAANGSNSVFSSITSTGGGYGNDYEGSGASGGSGGGAGWDADPPDNAGGAGTASQGYAGTKGFRVGSPTSSGAGGGGGGAGAAAGSTSTGTGGAGGAGVTTAISGVSTTYAGGGGGWGGTTGGAGGAGGGGAGYGGSATTGAGTNGTANTGGGAGGARGQNQSGGSGIVIVRYAA